MPLQRLLLRAMLWCLGAAALLGGLAILVSDSSMTWRISLTCVFGAVASALAIPMARLMDRAADRRAGLVGIVLIMVCFLMALAAVWAKFLTGSNQEKLALTALVLVPTSGAAFVGVWLSCRAAHRSAGRLGIAVSAAQLALTLVAIWGWGTGLAGRSEWTDTAAVLWMLFGLGVICLINAGARDGRNWRWVGVTAAAGAIVLAVQDIWFTPRMDPTPFAVAVTIACLTAYANLVMLIPLQPRHNWLRLVTLLAAIATGASIDTGVWLAADGTALDFVPRLAAATGIATGCGTLAQIVLLVLARRLSPDIAAPSDIHAITVVCPSCSTRQEIPLGGGACRTCRLGIDVQIRTPACASCGYTLLGLRGDRCPECGAAAVPPLPARA
ncbi:hypothetical protein PHYC_03861 [Phycisphaerales bacterium]|nr:hypothetical protein PHYC_03861 [Phycisphaerales bacterium]